MTATAAAGAAHAASPPPAPCPAVSGKVSEADVRCALEQWINTANARNPKAVTALYGRERVLLLSTLKAMPFTTEGEIEHYFEGLLAHDDFDVHLTNYPEKIDLFDNGGADSGFYIFSWKDHELPVVTPARFTFVFRLDETGHRLVIATHHSSAEPPSPTHHRRKGKR